MFLHGLVSDHDPFTYISCVAGITGMHHYTQLVGWDGQDLLTFSPGAGLKPQSSDLPSHVAGITGGTTRPGLSHLFGELISL
jgi:hypothetical protein